MANINPATKARAKFTARSPCSGVGVGMLSIIFTKVFFTLPPSLIDNPELHRTS